MRELKLMPTPLSFLKVRCIKGGHIVAKLRYMLLTHGRSGSRNLQFDSDAQLPTLHGTVDVDVLEQVTQVKALLIGQAS